jgi:hypothetical protein
MAVLLPSAQTNFQGMVLLIPEEEKEDLQTLFSGP